MTWILVTLFVALAAVGVGLIHARNDAIRAASVDDGELESDFIRFEDEGSRIDL